MTVFYEEKENRKGYEKMNKFELPERVKEKIASFHEETYKAHDQRERATDKVTALSAELGGAQAELDSAIELAISNPTPTNERKEEEKRSKVAELTRKLSDAEDRSRRAFSVGSNKRVALAREAIQSGKEESLKFYSEHRDEVWQNVADAKYAYLKSLVDYHHFIKNAASIYTEAVKQTMPTVEDGQNRPVFPQLPIFDSIYGVTEGEVRYAINYGKIHRVSCGEEREIQ